MDDNHRLGELATAINSAHKAAVEATRRTLAHALKAGDALLAARAMLPHGQWLPWLLDHCPAVAERSAQGYMWLARRRPLLENRSAADLTIRGAIEAIAGKPQIEAEIEPSSMLQNVVQFRQAARSENAEGGGWDDEPGEVVASYRLNAARSERRNAAREEESDRKIAAWRDALDIIYSDEQLFTAWSNAKEFRTALRDIYYRYGGEFFGHCMQALLTIGDADDDRAA
jgi:hypothetical protein